jgi:hypothetical protein
MMTMMMMMVMVMGVEGLGRSSSSSRSSKVLSSEKERMKFQSFLHGVLETEGVRCFFCFRDSIDFFYIY